MPGSIMVSVLEFIDLPLSSSTSIRASLGKIEYQVNDKGNLSFPLTSLRDDLIFKIQDAEGNEISRTGVQIKLILEKGVLEDNFPLGGGHLRLKLQFILSDEERDRIRSLRQSALKKKHELLSSGRRAEESDSRTMIGDAALPFRRNDENEANAGTGTEEGEYEKIRETKESKPKTSDNNGDENSGGPFNQNEEDCLRISSTNLNSQILHSLKHAQASAGYNQVNNFSSFR
ncbi:hypothetical protein GmHk_15G043923 [Glycine max]|nr:hypothetical protein GmHk_15G043923 [Glycine max]